MIIIAVRRRRRTGGSGDGGVRDFDLIWRTATSFLLPPTIFEIYRKLLNALLILIFFERLVPIQDDIICYQGSMASPLKQIPKIYRNLWPPCRIPKPPTTHISHHHNRCANILREEPLANNYFKPLPLLIYFKPFLWLPPLSQPHSCGNYRFIWISRNFDLIMKEILQREANLVRLFSWMLQAFDN